MCVEKGMKEDARGGKCNEDKRLKGMKCAMKDMETEKGKQSREKRKKRKRTAIKSKTKEPKSKV